MAGAACAMYILGERVNLKMNSFNSEAGSFDLTGSGLESISCLGKSFSKSGQDLVADLNDCVSLASARRTGNSMRLASSSSSGSASERSDEMAPGSWCGPFKNPNQSKKRDDRKIWAHTVLISLIRSMLRTVDRYTSHESLSRHI